MHFFRYGAQGEVLAIVLPPRLQKNSGVKEGDEYEFLEVSPGVFLLLGKQALAAPKGALVGKIAETLFENGQAQGRKGEAPGESKKYGEFKPAKQVDFSSPAPAAKTASPNYSPRQPVTQPAKRYEKAFWEQKIDAQGYAIVEEANSQTVSEQLEARVKKGEVVGVKGFDKKIYVAERSFYEGVAAKLQQAGLTKQFRVEEAAAASKTGEGACLTVLQIMKEGGEVLEKKKGVFQLVK